MLRKGLDFVAEAHPGRFHLGLVMLEGRAKHLPGPHQRVESKEEPVRGVGGHGPLCGRRPSAPRGPLTAAAAEEPLRFFRVLGAREAPEIGLISKGCANDRGFRWGGYGI